MPSRGERNNNPGNLEASPWTRSQPGYVGTDGRFAIFDDMASGIAAQVKLLESYIKRGFNSPSAIINRYGNDPGTADDASVRNYIEYAAKRLGIEPNTILGPNMAGELAQAMREFETGNTVKGIIDGVTNGASDAIDSVTGSIGSAVIPDSIENLLNGKTAARWTAVVVGIILVGLAIAAFMFINASGLKGKVIEAVT